MGAVMTRSIKSPAANHSYPESTLDLSLVEENQNQLQPCWGGEEDFTWRQQPLCLGHSQDLPRAWRQAWPLLLDPKDALGDNKLPLDPFSQALLPSAHSGLNMEEIELLLKMISLTARPAPLQILLQLVWLFSISLLSTDFPLLLEPAPQVVAVAGGVVQTAALPGQLHLCSAGDSAGVCSLPSVIPRGQMLTAVLMPSATFAIQLLCSSSHNIYLS